MKVAILTIPDCPSADLTVSLVKQALAEEDIDAVVGQVEIHDQVAARAARFLGSPTVQIEGADIELGRRADEAYTLTCRIYQGPQGRSGVPPTEMIRAAIRSARP